jgi:hypothetical protein
MPPDVGGVRFERSKLDAGVREEISPRPFGTIVSGRDGAMVEKAPRYSYPWNAASVLKQ